MSFGLWTIVCLCLYNRSSEEIVRPRVPLEACLASFSGPEEIPDFHSTALNSKTTAIKYAYFELCILKGHVQLKVLILYAKCLYQCHCFFLINIRDELI